MKNIAHTLFVGRAEMEEKPEGIPTIVMVLVFIAALLLFLFDGDDEAFSG